MTNMTASQYTPGPWTSDWNFIVAPDPNGIHPDIYIAEIAESDDEGRVATSVQQAANAQLIAASPKLLDALQYFFNIMHDYENSLSKGYVTVAMDNARAALTSAGAL